MKQKLIAHAARAATLCLALLAVGCSSFNSEWRQAASRKPSRDLSGRWEGRWVSTRNGHNGELRAVITRQPTVLIGMASPGWEKNLRFHALFHATYASMLTFTYPADFIAKKHGTRHEFQGATDLPAWAGGRYNYDGRVEGDRFIATYKSKYDDGRFEMKRFPSQYMNCQSTPAR